MVHDPKRFLTDRLLSTPNLRYRYTGPAILYTDEYAMMSFGIKYQDIQDHFDVKITNNDGIIGFEACIIDSRSILNEKPELFNMIAIDLNQIALELNELRKNTLQAGQ